MTITRPELACCGLLALLAFLVFPAFCQQGWSITQPISRKGSRAAISAVYYDGDDVWVVGAQGLIARSYDDGRTFQDVDSGVTTGLNDVFASGKRVWVVGDAGAILKSTDDGRHFRQVQASAITGMQPQTAGGNGSDLYSLLFQNDTHGYIVGDHGLILSTSDSGATWRVQKSGSDAQLFHVAAKGERAWAIGTAGTILFTDNGGATWSPQVSAVREDLNRVYVVADRVLLITGDNGVLLRSEDWGTNWSRVSLPLHDPLFGLSFIDKKTGWIVGYKGRIIRTFDGGRTWVEQESGTNVDLFAVSFHKNRGYAVGRDGLVLRYFERR